MQITVRTKEFGEALQSDVIRKLLQRDKDYKSLNLINWNAITDNDMEYTTDINKAKNAGRKGALVIWNGTWYNFKEVAPLYFSIGTRLYAGRWDSYDLTIGRVRDFDSAYIIYNVDKFETSELRKQRAEAKKGVDAFKTQAQLLKENKQKYKDMLDKLHAEKYFNVDLEKLLNDFYNVYAEANTLIQGFIQKYVSAADNLAANGYDMETISKIGDLRSLLSMINSAYNSVIGDISEIKRDRQSYTRYKEKHKDDGKFDEFEKEYYAEHIGRAVKDVLDEIKDVKDIIIKLKDKFSE